MKESEVRQDVLHYIDGIDKDDYFVMHFGNHYGLTLYGDDAIKVAKAIKKEAAIIADFAVARKRIYDVVVGTSEEDGEPDTLDKSDREWELGLVEYLLEKIFCCCDDDLIK